MQQSAKGGVILVDEASLIGTRDMARLFDIAEAVKPASCWSATAASIAA